jgi:hypothetical protein
MKRQKYPASIIKVGAVLHKVVAHIYDDDSQEIDFQEWVVRSIRKKAGTQSRFGHKSSEAHFYAQKYVHITHKCAVTWGKLSTKQFHRGWKKSIPEWNRWSFMVDQDLPRGFYTTKLSALKYAIADTKEDLTRYKQYQNDEEDPVEFADWNESITDAEKSLKLLTRRLKRMKSEKEKGKLNG